MTPQKTTTTGVIGKTKEMKQQGMQLSTEHSTDTKNTNLQLVSLNINCSELNIDR